MKMKHIIKATLLIGILAFVGCRKSKDIIVETAYKQNTLGSMQPIVLTDKYQQPPYQQIPLDECLLKDTLANGLTYYIYNYDQLKWKGKAYMQVIQKTGSLIEDDDCLGVAHFVEHTVFNGTKNFPENTAKEYLRRIGLPFAQDVNATTTFEYTEYHLQQVPVENKANIDTCLMILRDWAAYCSFNEESFERERKVILEENRLRLLEPNHDYYFKITNNLKYDKRFPIGSEQSIKQLTLNDVRNYYNKWYQPQNQAVVVVGDVDSLYVKDKIQEIFGELKRGDSQAPTYNFTPLKHEEPQVIITKENKLSYSGIMITYCLPTEKLPFDKNSTAWYLENYVSKDIAQTIQKRLERIKTETFLFNTVNIKTNRYRYKFDENIPFEISVTFDKENWQKALAAIVCELEKINRYGWTQKELNKCIPEPVELLSGRMTDSVDFSQKGYMVKKVQLDNIRNNFLYGNYLTSEKKSMNLEGYRMGRLNQSMEHDIFCDIDKKENITIFLMNLNDNVTEKEVLEVYNAARQSDLETEKYKYAEDPIYQLIMGDITVDAKPGKIVKKQKLDIEGCIEYKLNNGVTAIVCDAGKNTYSLLINGVRRGMMSYFNDEEAKKIRLLPQMITSQFDGMNSETENSWQNFGMFYDRYECFTFPLYTPPENWLKYLHYMLTNSNIDTIRFNKFRLNLLNTTKEPKTLISRKGSLWENFCYLQEFENRTGELSVQQIENMTLEEMSELCKKYKSNYNGSVFIIQCNYSPKKLKPLIAKYLGSLPSERNPIKMQNLKAFQLKNYDDSVYYHYYSQTPVANLMLSYIMEKNFKYNEEINVLADAFIHILRELLHNNIRLSDGSSYYFDCDYYFYTQTTSAIDLDIETTCAPDSVQPLVNRINTLIKEMSEGDIITSQHINNYINTRLNNLAPKPTYINSVNYLSNRYIDGRNYVISDPTLVKSITIPKLQAFIKDFMANSYKQKVIMLGDENGAME